MKTSSTSKTQRYSKMSSPHIFQGSTVMPSKIPRPMSLCCLTWFCVFPEKFISLSWKSQTGLITFLCRCGDIHRDPVLYAYGFSVDAGPDLAFEGAVQMFWENCLHHHWQKLKSCLSFRDWIPTFSQCMNDTLSWQFECTSHNLRDQLHNVPRDFVCCSNCWTAQIILPPQSNQLPLSAASCQTPRYAKFSPCVSFVKQTGDMFREVRATFIEVHLPKLLSFATKWSFHIKEEPMTD